MEFRSKKKGSRVWHYPIGKARPQFKLQIELQRKTQEARRLEKYKNGTSLIRESDGKKFKIINQRKVVEFGNPIIQYQIQAENGSTLSCNIEHLERDYTLKRGRPAKSIGVSKKYLEDIIEKPWLTGTNDRYECEGIVYLAKKILNGEVPRGKMLDKDFIKQLAIGTKVEMEHTDNPEVARRIALDHLRESPCYYTHLLKMEKKLKKEGCGGKVIQKRMNLNGQICNMTILREGRTPKGTKIRLVEGSKGIHTIYKQYKPMGRNTGIWLYVTTDAIPPRTLMDLERIFENMRSGK